MREKRNKYIQIRVTPTQKKLWQNEAKKFKTSLSEFVEWCINTIINTKE